MKERECFGSDQQWEVCLKIVTGLGKTHFKKEDADYLMPEKAKLLQNKRKTGAKSKEKTKEFHRLSEKGLSCGWETKDC